ncbi:MAG: NAD(P)/FAD-dependent oxidoreductase, partial [Sulfurimonas sp.]|nr:NAD(P)/FAD-dependent oxidoreductase [Sulfurimonas sp.]
MGKKVAIVGAGASGLLCAILCSKKNLEVSVFEQNSKLGKKILVSGNGRCNITNTKLSSKDYYSQNPDFVTQSLKEFDFKEFE